MSTHNIDFYEILTKLILQLSSNIIKYVPKLFGFFAIFSFLIFCTTPFSAAYYLFYLTSSRSYDITCQSYVDELILKHHNSN